MPDGTVTTPAGLWARPVVMEPHASVASRTARTLREFTGRSPVAATAAAGARRGRARDAACAEVVEVQDRVEHHEVVPDRLAPIDRVVREQHVVALLAR